MLDILYYIFSYEYFTMNLEIRTLAVEFKIFLKKKNIIRIRRKERIKRLLPSLGEQTQQAIIDIFTNKDLKRFETFSW